VEWCEQVRIDLVQDLRESIAVLQKPKSLADEATNSGKKREENSKLKLLIGLAGAQYDPLAKCPRFLVFLDRIQGDREIIEFMQRCVGYSLSGETSEQCMFILTGTRANGKPHF
jgi:phage/plasmid-associated DNA primase